MKRVIFLTIFALLSLVALFGYQYFTFHDRKLHVIFCNVGQGDAALIVTPTNHYILVDAGPDRSVLDCLAQNMPFWQRTIDLVILTHPHSDHFSGLYYVLERYHVSAFATEQLINKTVGFEELLRIIAKKQIPKQFVFAGDTFRIGEVNLSIQAPTKEFITQTSPGGTIGEGKEFANVITNISYRTFAVLLTGDTQAEALQEAVSRAGKSIDVLHVPHHGSASGLNESVLERLQPKIAVISVGKNRYGHPTKHTLGLLEEAGIRVLRTDQSGTIEIVSDGATWKVKQ